MANITVDKDTSKPAPAGLARRESWDPFVTMRDLMRWDPFRDTTLIPWIDPSGASFSPAFEVKETKDGYLFKADVPGVKESDLDITRTGNRLSVSGKREAEKEEQSDTYYTYERNYGSFTRSFTLPEGIDADHIHAELKEGVLTMLVPKKPEMQPKKISLKGIFEKKS